MSPPTRSAESVADHLGGLIRERHARIAVLGLGYVGLPTALAYVEAGFEVSGIDIDADRVRDLSAGHSHVRDVEDSRLAAALSTGKLAVTLDSGHAGAADVIDICVHTPLDETHVPDLSAIELAGRMVAAHLHAGQLVILTSTSYPGTTTDVLAPILAEAGFGVGEEILLAFAPERIDPGNTRFDMRNTPRVVGGINAASTRAAAELIATLTDTVVPVNDSATAEMVKLLENTFRMVNIGFANEIAMICRRLGIDVWEVIDAAATKPFGYMAFRPGPGVGGHCIPVDPSYLQWKMRNLNFRTRFIDTGNDINRGMPDYIVRRAQLVLNERSRSIRGSRILLLGVAYKPNIGDTRESPAIEIANGLFDLGGDVSYSDPLVPSLRLVPTDRVLHTVDLTAELVALSDLVIIVTDHDGLDHAMVAAEAQAVLDTRGAIPRALRRSDTWWGI